MLDITALHALLTDWLTDWLIDWLTDWLTDWMSNWLTNCLTDWLTVCLTNWLTEWLTDCLSDQLTDWLTDLLTDLLVELLNTFHVRLQSTMKIFYGVSFTHGLRILVVPSKTKEIVKKKIIWIALTYTAQYEIHTKNDKLGLCKGVKTNEITNKVIKILLWNLHLDSHRINKTLPPFSLIRDFRNENTRGNVSKISVNHPVGCI